MLIYFLLIVMVLCESTVFPKNVGKKKVVLRQNYVMPSSHSGENDEELRHSEKTDEFMKRDNCWVGMKAENHIHRMENIEEQYASVRESFRKAAKTQNQQFNEMILQNMIRSRGVASSAAAASDSIPAGLNLGGYCVMKLLDSLLIFHRIKLRNNTRFRINSLATDFDKMVVKANLSLNDLHLVGSFERAWNPPGGDPSHLYYAPTYGLAELLLQNVDYQLEGRLRFIGDSTYIVLTTSKLNFPHGIMTFKNNASHMHTQEVKKDSVFDFLDRLKSDLDDWLRDYLNEQLLYHKPATLNNEIRNYHQKRNEELNNYVADVITSLKTRLLQLNTTVVELPSFKITSTVEFTLSDGLLRGLDSIYRRSVATGGVEDGIRKVDVIVGFSDLKAQYKYTASLKSAELPITGMIILSADDLTAHMSMRLNKDSESVDLNFDFIQHLKPESLIVEGPASRMIANYKHLLEYHITSIMSGGVYDNIRQLQNILKCHQTFFRHQSEEIMPESKPMWPAPGTNSQTQTSNSGDSVEQSSVVSDKLLSSGEDVSKLISASYAETKEDTLQDYEQESDY